MGKSRHKPQSLRSFCFVVDGKLAGMGRPGIFADLSEELRVLKGEGIGAIVSLTEDRLDAGLLAKAGFEKLHLPIRDFSAPKLRQVERFVKFVNEMNARAIGVVVHCGTGSGRTGAMLACYLVSKGLTAEEAIRTVRKKRSSYIETQEQEEAVRRYEESLTRKKRSSA